MSYACATVMYGIRATETLAAAVREHTDFTEWEDLGFVQMYSGSDESTPYLGVDLYDMDECGDVRVSDMKLTPTPEQKAEAERKIAELPEPIRAAAGSPDVWIIWSSS